jgi:phosphoribosyl 1,2-cyclic phosphodiesterase
MNYELLGSGSEGNSIIYKDNILVDVGLPFNKIEPYLKRINIILLTHKHGDHFNESSIIRIGREYPNILMVAPESLYSEFKNLNYAGKSLIVKEGQKFKFGDTLFECFKLFHDVSNVGWKINKKGFKIIHATDTGSIDHIEAKDYDLYAIEHNYDEEIIKKAIMQKAYDGVFAYEVRSKEYHLSFQKASDWILSQKKDDSEILMLHISSSYV